MPNRLKILDERFKIRSEHFERKKKKKKNLQIYRLTEQITFPRRCVMLPQCTLNTQRVMFL